MKKIIIHIKNIYNKIELSFYYFCLTLSKGFFFYFYLLFSLLEKTFKLRIFKKAKRYFEDKQEEPIIFLLICIFTLITITIYSNLYIDKNDIIYIDNNIIHEINEGDENEKQKKKKYIEEINTYRKYSKMNIKDIDFDILKNTNPDIVAWLSVNGTNINYPITKTTDNNYYLTRDINKRLKVTGWTFMDYRNNENLEDNNTIFYGHNLLNKTAFGSISNIFTDNWYKNENHYIIVLTKEKKNIYEVFSSYTINKESYYLQYEFYDSNSYLSFLNTIKNRSKYDYKVELTENDKIITLSTCTKDNKQRQVVHAKLLNTNNTTN